MKDQDNIERFNIICDLLLENTEIPLEGIMLFSEVGPGTCTLDIYRNLWDCALYVNDGLDDNFTEIGDEIMALWKSEPRGKRWARIAFAVLGGMFEVAFTYPDEIKHRINPNDDPDIDMETARNEDYDRQREEAVRRYFGDKPIVYPPLTPPSVGQLFEL